MKHSLWRLVFPTFLLAVLPGTGLLASDSWYAGAAVGRASERDTFQNFTVESQELGYKIFGGYKFFEVLSAEVSIIDFDEFVEKTPDGTLSEEIANATVWARVEAPMLERVHFTAALGVSYAETEVRLRLPADRLRDSESDTDIAWSLGLAFETGRQWKLRVEYDGFNTGSVSKLELFSIGMQRSF